MTTIDSEFGNSSATSSIASFMSGLLQESFSKLEISNSSHHEQTHFPLKINIVSDNAKSLSEHSRGINRCQSLVTMQRNKYSGQSLSRWSTDKQRREHQTSRGGLVRKVSSETKLLRLPTRKMSPLVTTHKRLGEENSGKNQYMNAKWGAPQDLSPNRPARVLSKEGPPPALRMSSSSTSLVVPRSKSQRNKQEAAPKKTSSSSELPMPIRRPSVQPAVSESTHLQSPRLLVASVFHTSRELSAEDASAAIIETPRFSNSKLSKLSQDSSLVALMSSY